jgi:hypothetical protein
MHGKSRATKIKRTASHIFHQIPDRCDKKPTTRVQCETEKLSDPVTQKTRPRRTPATEIDAQKAPTRILTG